MKEFKIALSIFLLFIFVVLSSVFLFMRGADKTFLEESFYRIIFERIEVSPIVKEEISRSLLEDYEELIEEVKVENEEEEENGNEEEGEEEEEELKEDHLEKDDIEEAIQTALDRTLEEEWVKENFFLALSDILAFVKGEEEELTVVIALEDKKRIFQYNFERELERRLPENVEIKDDMAEEIPDEIVLSNIMEEAEGAEEMENALLFFRTLYGYYEAYSYHALIGISALLILLLGVTGGLKWIGSGMLVSGALVFFSMLLGKNTLFNMISGKAFVDKDALTFVFDFFFEELSTTSLYYGLIGAGILIATFVIIRIRKP